MKRAAVFFAATSFLVLAAGCASTNGASSSSSGPAYWVSKSAGTSTFAGDNGACSARASRLGGMTGAPPENRLDKPIQKWPNATAQEAYDACMLERGWRPAG